MYVATKLATVYKAIYVSPESSNTYTHMKGTFCNQLQKFTTF